MPPPPNAISNKQNSCHEQRDTTTRQMDSLWRNGTKTRLGAKLGVRHASHHAADRLPAMGSANIEQPRLGLEFCQLSLGFIVGVRMYERNGSFNHCALA